uniref:Uncharacterized protein n=1 Tax=Arundo donax TaxID=35708 RepID=A0A0A9BZK1_ARUDO
MFSEIQSCSIITVGAMHLVAYTADSTSSMIKLNRFSLADSRLF